MKVKKTIKIILKMLLVIFVILLCIQIVDQIINKEEYAKSKETVKKMFYIIKQHEYCAEQYSKTTILLINDKDGETKIKKKLEDEKYYSSVLKSCREAENELKRIEIPELKSSEKENYLRLARDNFAGVFQLCAESFEIMKNEKEFSRKVLTIDFVMGDALINGYNLPLPALMTYSIADIIYKRPVLSLAKKHLDKLLIDNYGYKIEKRKEK